MNTSSVWMWAAALDFTAAGLHLAIIVGGPAWYRFFGAGEGMAKMAERGHPWPAMLTLVIALVLMVFGAYAMTAGGHFTQLPWTGTALWGIAALFTLRGVLPFLLAPFMPSMRTPFSLWSSGICTLYAATHLITVW